MSEILFGRTAIKARQIRPGQGYATEVKSGQSVQITDMQGKQVADFVAFAKEDRGQTLSTSHTRAANGSIMLQVGMKLYTNRREPMFELVEDTVGRHDLLFAACDPARYRELGLDDHANCRGALAKALAAHDIADDRIPDPVNWFMNVAIRQRGELEVREPLSEKNDQVVLTALMDTIIAVSACPQDQNATNGFAPSDILVRVYR
ncbi:MAG: hypothetical protein AVDCRST_MAG73-1321 [uncultured Thermomicrobiales bacterium]|uniref:DUF1989 domain-containing protein n=1 Tax=uncultured Thermomicrobiales bacterium TaxID=1645740 RepID=A0A6J4U0C1_9BACT|nr:MAG: hypothetical protein AVDCRST_MAG73-1321 [uncultured Thermomicrobiales bacterium]